MSDCQCERDKWVAFGDDPDQWPQWLRDALERVKGHESHMGDEGEE